MHQERQLPRKQIELRRCIEDRRDAREHAQWAGMAMAEALVARQCKLEKLTEVEIERFRKQYQVYSYQKPTMLAACKRAFPVEMVWATTP
jgi:hypothetical protein